MRAEGGASSGSPVRVLWAVVAVLALSGCATETERRADSLAAAYRFISDYHVSQVDSAALYRAAMEGMLADLDDPYTRHLSAEKLAVWREEDARYGAVGAVVWAEAGREGGPVAVTEVRPGGPAERAGVRPGDVLVPALEEERPLVVDWRIRGPVGRRYRFRWVRPAAGWSRRLELGCRDLGPPRVARRWLSDRIALVEVPRCAPRTPRRLKRALEAATAEEMRGLVLDLRANGGGRLKAAARMCDLFLPDGTAFQTDGRREELRETYRTGAPTAVPPELPMAVLVDGRTASAAEVVAGALQARGRAVLVGTRTFGKGRGTVTFELPDETGLLVAVLSTELHDAGAIEGRGLTPDVHVGAPVRFPEPDAPLRNWVWFPAYRRSREQQVEAAVGMVRERMGTR
ncbi:MAG: S41 family peptidase [Planctomycetota bacterium]